MSAQADECAHPLDSWDPAESRCWACGRRVGGRAWGDISAQDERYFVRVRAALQDFQAGHMTIDELRAYLRRTSA